MTRNPWAMSRVDEALARLQEFSEEAGGMMRLYLVRYDNEAIRKGTDGGDPLAMILALTIGKALHGIRDGGYHCVSCDRELTSEPHAFLIWMPHSNEDKRPDHLITQGCCADCCRRKNDNQLLHDGMVYIRQIFPDTEEVTEASEFIDE